MNKHACASTPPEINVLSTVIPDSHSVTASNLF